MANVFKGVVFDKEFVLKPELRRLGFRPSDIKDEYFRFQDKVQAHLTQIYEDDIKEARKQLRNWKEEVKFLLSRPVGKYRHKKRPARNLLPMMNSGKLHDTVKVYLKTTRGEQYWDYELTVKFDSKHAELTNYNITSRGQNKRKVAWYGWADKMLTGNGLKNVISARNLMRSLFR